MTRPVAVVTGASAGVGRAVVRRLAADGYDVGLIARGRAGLEAAARDVERSGGRAEVAVADVAEWSQVDEAADRIEGALGPVDVWVNDAMTTVFGRLRDIRPDEFRRATDVTYLGQVHGTMAALDRMRARDRGTIVNVGSALAFVAIPLQAAYCGAKFAARGFTESVQAELLHDGSNVRLTMVHLPAVDTPQFEWCENKMAAAPQPVPPIYSPDDAATAIVDAVHGEARSTVLGAWNRLIVLGTKVAPGLLHRYAARTGYDSQQTDEPSDRDRPSNLFAPVDDDTDHGALGRFTDRSGGVLDPAFLRDLPGALADFGRAGAEAAQSVLDRLPGGGGRS